MEDIELEADEVSKFYTKLMLNGNNERRSIFTVSQRTTEFTEESAKFIWIFLLEIKAAEAVQEEPVRNKPEQRPRSTRKASEQEHERIPLVANQVH